MTKRIIYYGLFNNHKKEELIEKSLEKLKKNEGSKFYYLLPNGELLTKYRRDFIDEVKQTFEINLYTFDNIVKNILEYDNSININEAIKNLIIKKIIKKLNTQGKIKYYQDFISMEGFFQSVNAIIGEIKRSLIYPREYLEKCPKNPYYKEIGLIYESYENYLKKYNLVDREGAYFKAIEILKDSKDYFKGLEFIIIDEFYDFRPIEIAILKEICKSDIDIYINIPFKMKYNPSNINQTIKVLKDIGFRLEYVEKEESSFFEKLGINLFYHEEKKLEYNEDLYLIKAPSIYLELKKIFEEIKSYYKEGIHLDEMAIVLLNDDYKDILIEVAEEEKVPITLAKEKTLRQVPLVGEFLNIINMKINKLDKQSIVNRIKSYYFKILKQNNRNSMEFILRKLDFKDMDELKYLLLNEKEINISMEYAESMKKMIKEITNEISSLRNQDYIDNYNNIFIEIIEKYDLKKEIYERYKKNKDYDLFHRDLSSLGKLKEILNDLSGVSDIVGEISIEDYYQILCKLLEENSIQDSNENIKGVKILNPINTRGFKHQILFVSGLSQEQYPNLRENNFFLNDENARILKNIGLDVKDYYERLNNEGIKFASLLSSSNKKLYLSFSEGLEGNDITSIFLDELLNLIDGVKLKDKVNLIDVNLGYLIKENIKNISTEKELFHYILLNQNKEISKDLKKALAKYNEKNKGSFGKINEKLISEDKRNEKEFNEYSGLIDEEKIIRDIKIKNENKVYSNTYLETYAKCPYHFLLSRLLNVEEVERYFEEYSPMDMGNIYHEVLNQYYKNYKEDIVEKIKDKENFKVENTLKTIKKLIYSYGGDYGYNSKNKSDLLILENTKEKIEKFIYEDIKRLSKNKESLIPHGFEVAFGMDDEFFIEVDGEKIRLKGKIDRIDKILNEDKYIIMDYKSSDYGIYDIDKIRQGLSLQLPIYVMSQEDKNIVAGIYGVLKDAKFQVTIGIIDETTIISRRHKGHLNQEEWEDLMELTKINIKKIKENILKADFSVDPLECSDYCIYKDICRYENRLELE